MDAAAAAGAVRTLLRLLSCRSRQPGARLHIRQAAHLHRTSDPGTTAEQGGHDHSPQPIVAAAAAVHRARLRRAGPHPTGPAAVPRRHQRLLLLRQHWDGHTRQRQLHCHYQHSTDHVRSLRQGAHSHCRTVRRQSRRHRLSRIHQRADRQHQHQPRRTRAQGQPRRTTWHEHRRDPQHCGHSSHQCRRRRCCCWARCWDDQLLHRIRHSRDPVVLGLEAGLAVLSGHSPRLVVVLRLLLLSTGQCRCCFGRKGRLWRMHGRNRKGQQQQQRRQQRDDVCPGARRRDPVAGVLGRKDRWDGLCILF